MKKVYVRLKCKPIQDFIIKNNMSLRAFSHKVGYDSGQVSNWLSGKRFIGNSAREKVQKYMKLDWDTLFKIVDESEIIREELQKV